MGGRCCAHHLDLARDGGRAGCRTRRARRRVGFRRCGVVRAKDDAKDQAAEPKTDPTKTGPPAGDVTGTDRESDGKIPTTSGPAVDKDAAEDVGEDAKEAVAEDVPVTSEPEPDPSGSEDTIVPEPVVNTGEGHSAAAAQRSDSRETVRAP